MKSKQFIRAAIIVSGAGSLLFFCSALPAQTVAPPAVPKKAGHVRLWNMVFVNPTALDLVPSNAPEGRAIQTAQVANYFAPYETLPPGRYSLRVFRAGDRLTPLKSFDVALPDKGYFTILVQYLPGGQLSAELLDDTPDPLKPPSNRLTVRQTCFVAHSLVVSASTQHTEPLEPGATQTLEGLPDGLLTVSARGLMAKGSKNWNGEADFRIARHATIFVIGDSYGRLRLRSASNGPSPAEEAETAAAAKGTP